MKHELYVAWVSMWRFSQRPTLFLGLVLMLSACSGGGGGGSGGSVNRAPVANAGMDQLVDTGTQVTLDGTGSSDADGDVLSYLWTVVQVPPTSAITDLINNTQAQPYFTPDVDGIYRFSLVVGDGVVDSSPDEAIITSATSLADGSPCAQDSDCAGGTCLTETLSGFPGGVCTTDCTLDPNVCAAGTVCLASGGASFCMPECVGTADCRQGYACNDLILPGSSLCTFDCVSDLDCGSGTCNPYTGKCEALQGLGVDAAPCAINAECESGYCDTVTTNTCFSLCDLSKGVSACPDPAQTCTAAFGSPLVGACLY